MRVKNKFGMWLGGLGLSAALMLPCAAAQRNRDQAPKEQHRPPERQQRNDRPTYHPQTAPRRNESRAPEYRGGRNDSRPSNDNRRSTTDTRPGGNQSRQPNYDRPNYDRSTQNRPPATQYRAPDQNPQERLRNMTPQERQRIAQTEDRYRRLPQNQQQQLRDRARVWEQMTPEQRTHIRNDILPKWQQMTPQRQKAIQNRLGVLQNMPESARNRHLNDPNFTRGMSEEDKEMLRDLSHQHVGAPEPPPSEQ